MRIGHKLPIPLIAVSIGNLVESIQTSKPPIHFISNIGVFVVFVIALLLPKKNEDKFMSISLIIFSCIGAWFGTYTDINCVLILIFALYISGNNKKTHIIYLSIFATVIVTKYAYLGLKIPQLVVFSGGVSAFMILYYHYMAPKEVNNTKVLIDYSTKDIPPKVLDIVEWRAQGYDWPEINDKLCDRNVTYDTIRRDFAKGRDDAGFHGNDFAFGVHCSQSGIIRSISLEDDTGLN